MNESRMDSVLNLLAAHTPKAPVSLVETMVRTVNELNRLREQNTKKTAGNADRKAQVLPGEAELRKPDKHKKIL